MGRPTIYSKEILKRAKDYLEHLPEDEVVHSIEGLALAIDVNRDTIYDWKRQEDKKDFSDIVNAVLEMQGKKLVNKGLKGEFNSKIAAVMMSKHGYREGHELTGKDGKDLPVPILGNVPTDDRHEKDTSAQ